MYFDNTRNVYKKTPRIQHLFCHWKKVLIVISLICPIHFDIFDLGGNLFLHETYIENPWIHLLCNQKYNIENLMYFPQRIITYWMGLSKSLLVPMFSIVRYGKFIPTCKKKLLISLWTNYRRWFFIWFINTSRKLYRHIGQSDEKHSQVLFI